MAKIDVSGLTVAELNELHAQVVDATEKRRAQDLATFKAAVLAMTAKAGYSPGQLMGMLKGEAPKGKAKAKGKPRAKPSVKFRSKDGKEWTGRGQKPAWLRAHIEAGGKEEELAA
jgi:DNA-binding protein H-NS